MLTLRLKHTDSPLLRAGVVTIVLSQYSRDHDHDICITHGCRTVEQVRKEIERLKAELDAIFVQATKKL